MRPWASSLNGAPPPRHPSHDLQMMASSSGSLHDFSGALGNGCRASFDAAQLQQLQQFTPPAGLRQSAYGYARSLTDSGGLHCSRDSGGFLGSLSQAGGAWSSFSRQVRGCCEVLREARCECPNT